MGLLSTSMLVCWVWLPAGWSSPHRTVCMGAYI